MSDANPLPQGQPHHPLTHDNRESEAAGRDRVGTRSGLKSIINTRINSISENLRTIVINGTVVEQAESTNLDYYNNCWLLTEVSATDTGT